MGYRRELLSRWALVFLVVLLPALALTQLLLPVEESLSSGSLGSGAPAPPSSRYLQVLVVTLSQWPDTPDDAAIPEVREFRRNSARADRAYANAASPAASAASLWTGRWVREHGVTDSTRRLPRGTWTLADSARRGGFATGAFLEEPFVAVTGIAGFEKVEEHTERNSLLVAQNAVEFLRKNRGNRTLAWVHFHDPSPDLAPLEALLGGYRRELAEAGDSAEFFSVLTAFEGKLPESDSATGFDPPQVGDASPEPEAWRVPLLVRFPGDANSRRTGSGFISLSDVTGMLRGILSTPPPDRLRGQRAISSRSVDAAAMLRGSAGSDWTWFRGDNALLYLENGVAVRAPIVEGRPALDALRFHWTQVPPAAETEAVGPYRGLAERFAAALAEKPETSAGEPSQVPRAWRGLRGW